MVPDIRGLAASALCLVVVACGGQSDDSFLERAAAHARAHGKVETTVNLTVCPVAEADGLDDVLAEYAALMVTVVDRATVRSDDRIDTWYRLAVSRELSKGRSGPFSDCDRQIPSVIAPRKGERALPLLAGSVDVGGVAVEMVSFQSSIRLADTQPYLMLGRLCGDDVMELPLGPSGIFLVDAGTGRLTATSATPRPFVAELLSRAGTVPALEVRLSVVPPLPRVRSGGWRPRARARPPQS